MLHYSEFKNIEISELTLTPNAAAIVKQSGKTLKVIYVDGVKNCQPLTLVKTMLTAALADFMVSAGLTNEFGALEYNGELWDTGLKQRPQMSALLSSFGIYKTDSAGHLQIGVKCDTPLNKTALKVSDKHLITKVHGAHLKAAIHNQAKLILAQCSVLTDMSQMYDTICVDQNGKTADKDTKTKTTTTTTAAAV